MNSFRILESWILAAQRGNKDPQKEKPMAEENEKNREQTAERADKLPVGTNLEILN